MVGCKYLTIEVMHDSPLKLDMQTAGHEEMSTLASGAPLLYLFLETARPKSTGEDNMS